MTAYTYNEITFEYTGQITLAIDKLDGKYIMPANCTTKPILAKKEDYTQVYNSKIKDWEYEADYRGTWYKINSTEKVEVTSLYDTKKGKLSERIKYDYADNILNYDGNQLVKISADTNQWGLPSDFVEYDSASNSYVLKTSISRVQEELISLCAKKYEAVESSSISVNGYIFQADTEAAQNASTVLLSGLSPICWITEDNNHIVITKDELQFFFTTCVGRNQKALVIYQLYREEVNALTSYDDLAKFEPNWMEVFKYNALSESEKANYTEAPTLTNMEARFDVCENITLAFDRDPISLDDVSYGIDLSGVLGDITSESTDSDSTESEAGDDNVSDELEVSESDSESEVADEPESSQEPEASDESASDESEGEVAEPEVSDDNQASESEAGDSAESESTESTESEASESVEASKVSNVNTEITDDLQTQIQAIMADEDLSDEDKLLQIQAIIASSNSTNKSTESSQS